MRKLTILRADDWVSVYSNDQRIHNGHEVEWEDLLREQIDNGTWGSMEILWEDDHDLVGEYFSRHVGFPDDLRDVFHPPIRVEMVHSFKDPSYVLFDVDCYVWIIIFAATILEINLL